MGRSMPESACLREEASDRVTYACVALPMANPSLTTAPWWTLPMCGDPVGHVAILYLGLDPWFASHLPEVRIVVPSPGTEQSHLLHWRLWGLLQWAEESGGATDACNSGVRAGWW